MSGACRDPAEGRSLMGSAVKDVMTTSVLAIGESVRYEEIIVGMRQRRVSACPALDAADRVIGVVSEADLLLKEVGPEPFTGPGRSLRASGRRGERAKAVGERGRADERPAGHDQPRRGRADAARLMFERGVKRLPVVDGADQLVGIVSRIDLLSVFTRPDGQIRGDVLQQVIVGKLALNPAVVDVTVTLGAVTVSGQVERRAVAIELTNAVRHVEGVVRVRDRVSYPPGDPADGRSARVPYHHLEMFTVTSPNGHNRPAIQRG